MAISTLDQNTSLILANQNNDFTQSQLEANPQTAALAVPFAEFRAVRLTPTLLLELNLQYGVALAKARAVFADTILNNLVKKLDGALWMITHGDTTAPLYEKYFGEQRPHEVIAPLLGPQLETMRAWIPSLLASPHATLQAIGAEIQAAVAVADDTVTKRKEAEDKLSDFSETGERAQTIEAYNALRKATWGKLGEMQHQNPALPSGFADSFFLHEARKRDDRLSSAQIQAKLASLEEDVALWNQKLQKALDREREESVEATARAARETELAEKRKQAEALAAEIKKLEGK